MSTPLITVFGATGAQGGGLVRSLLAAAGRPFRVRAVTRRPDGEAARRLAALGAEVVRADLDEPASVVQAMTGAYGAFCVTDYWAHRSPQRELAQAATLADAAACAKLRHVVWSTMEDTRELCPADGRRLPVLQGRYNVPCFDAKGEASRHFLDRGLPLTLLHGSFHWDDLAGSARALQRRDDGRLVLVLPLGRERLPGIAAADIGACAAAVFRRGDGAIGRSLGVAGEHLGGEQMAQALTRALGEPVDYRPLSPAQYAAQGFAGADVLANMFRFTTEFAALHQAARPVAQTRVLHRGLLSFDGWLRQHADRIARPERRAA